MEQAGRANMCDASDNANCFVLRGQQNWIDIGSKKGATGEGGRSGRVRTCVRMRDPCRSARKVDLHDLGGPR